MVTGARRGPAGGDAAAAAEQRSPHPAEAGPEEERRGAPERQHVAPRQDVREPEAPDQRVREREAPDEGDEERGAAGRDAREQDVADQDLTGPAGSGGSVARRAGARAVRGAPTGDAADRTRTAADEAAAGRIAGAQVTSKDVARVVGVSQATVSLVLGDKWRGRVSERTAEAVRSAARDLGYRPNLAARSLRLGRTRTALLVVPALTTEFFARVYTGAARVAADHGFGVVLYPSPEGIGPARDPFDSARASLDGVIASSMAAEALAAVRGGGLPLVMLDSDPDDAGAAATVNPDIAGGMRQVAEHLLALGHRRIVHIGADVDSWTFRVRARALAGAFDAVPGAGVRVERAGLSVEGGRQAAERALAGAGPRPTALVCDDDVLAAGVCKAVRRLGLRVPDDISVTGFDDLALAAALEPELTTVRLPAEQVGAHGMEALLAVLDGRPADGGSLPVELVVRGSTARPA